MPTLYCHHRIACSPRQWKAVADRIVATAPETIAPQGGNIYGIWRSQIGRPRDELNAITQWPSKDAAAVASSLCARCADVLSHETVVIMPTIRPTDHTPPTKQGNYAFRWFETPPGNWDEFIGLCEAAWPGVEASYDDVQVLGLWRFDGPPGGLIKSLMITRRPDLAMWERTKLPQGEAEIEVRRKLSRRYDLCETTEVQTATLLTATDREDTARWT